MSLKIVVVVSLLLTTNIGAESNLDEFWQTVTTTNPKYEKTTKVLQELQQQYPNIMKLYTVGRSVEGRELWVIQLSKNVDSERLLLKPMVKIVANMHGDETLGRALSLILAVDIIRRFQKSDSRIVKLMETTDLHLMPSLNPDGFEASKEGDCNPNYNATSVSRQNKNHRDLNRDFPDQFVINITDEKAVWNGRQPETLSVMKWITSKPFVLSANFHGGVVITSYPFDSVPKSVENTKNYDGYGIASISPDNDIFVYLAKLYADNHKTMRTVTRRFPKGDGLINGAFWYNVRGGMQDFNYVFSNCFEITMELSDCKYPMASELLEEYEKNQESLLKYLEGGQLGIKGLILNKKGLPIKDAEILVHGINRTIKSTDRGEYWRLLIPGKYEVTAQALKHIPQTFHDIYVKAENTTVLNFILETDHGAYGNLKTESESHSDTIIYTFLFNDILLCASYLVVLTHNTILI